MHVISCLIIWCWENLLFRIATPEHHRYNHTHTTIEALTFRTIIYVYSLVPIFGSKPWLNLSVFLGARSTHAVWPRFTDFTVCWPVALHGNIPSPIYVCFSIAVDHSHSCCYLELLVSLAGWSEKDLVCEVFDSSCPVSCWAMPGSARCYGPCVLLRIGLFLSLLHHCHNASLPPNHRRAAATPKLVSGILPVYHCQ